MENSHPAPVAPQPPVNPEVERIQRKAKTFGIVGLATAVFVPFVGIGFGIAAIVQAAKARAQSRAVGEQPPRQFGTQRTMGIIAIIIGAIMSVAIVLGTIALVTAFGVVASSIGSNPGYSSRISAMEAANKSFNINETVEFGPYDLTFKDLQKGYAPTAEEAADIKARIDRVSGVGYYTKPNPVYTKFTISLELNKERAKLYNYIEMDIPSWGTSLSQVNMDDNLCITLNATRKQLREYDDAYGEGYDDPTSLSVVCIGDSPEPTALKLDVSAFSAVSSFVGTEGMPRKDFTYNVTF